MAFHATTTIDSDTAKITMSGELDANMAPVFQKAVENVAAHKVRHLVLVMSDVEYISAAGLRALLFAKEKMGAGVELSVIGAQPQIKDTLQMTGLDRYFVLKDEA